MYAPETTVPTAHGAPPHVVSRLLSDTDVAEELGVTARQVQGWIRRGLLTGTHPARGVWRVRRDDLQAWLDAGQPRRVPEHQPRPRRTPVPAPIDPATLRVRPLPRRAARKTAR